jgi:PAS domain S-box-containing protein
MSDETSATVPGAYSEERSAHLLIETIEDYAIYMLDLEGFVRSWNPGAEAIKGYAREEILGTHFSVFFTPEDRAAAEPERELLAAVDAPQRLEGWRVRKDGSRFRASVVITGLRDEKRRLKGFAKVTRDLTEAFRSEEERLRLARVEEALRVRNEFFREARSSMEAVAVSMRVHLRSLASTVDTLEGDGLSTKLQMLEWGIDRMTRSIERVTRLSEEAADSLAHELSASTSGSDRVPPRPPVRHRP